MWFSTGQQLSEIPGRWQADRRQMLLPIDEDVVTGQWTILPAAWKRMAEPTVTTGTVTKNVHR